MPNINENENAPATDLTTATNLIMAEMRKKFADAEAKLDAKTAAAEAKAAAAEARIAALVANSTAGSKLATAFGAENIEKLETANQSAKTIEDVRRNIINTANAATALLATQYKIDEIVNKKVEPSPLIYMTASGYMWKRIAYCAGGAVVAAGAGYAGYRMGHKNGAKEIIDSRLQAWRGESDELHMQMSDGGDQDVRVTFAAVPTTTTEE